MEQSAETEMIPEVDEQLTAEAPEPQEVLVLDDARWEELIELTNGAAAQCFQCGVCTATCPWSEVRDEPVRVRSLMRAAQLGLENGNESLWLCTTCAQCEAYCPRGVDITAVFRGLRQAAWERRAPEKGLPSVMWSIFWNNNPWTQAPSQRSLWAKDMVIEDFDPAVHEVLLYVGCTPSYDQRAQKVARSLVQVLEAAAVKFGTLKDDEPCCGESALNVGHKDYFRDLVDQASRVFEERGVGKMVTISPHCFDVFENHYPRMNLEFEPVHYTQFLAELIGEGRLSFKQNGDLKVTFQDPCYLARHNREEVAPRRVINAIPGVKLSEMDYAGADTLCCGGGGGRMFLETAAGERFGDLRVEQARETGAEILVTACPFCISCLEDSVKAKKVEDLVVMDIAELGALALVG